MDEETSTNYYAATQTISTLIAMGRLETVDQALVVAVLSMATALDECPDKASLWGEYISALDVLVNTGHPSEAFEELIEELKAKGE